MGISGAIFTTFIANKDNELTGKKNANEEVEENLKQMRKKF